VKKTHIESRTRGHIAKALCGIDMPADYDAWGRGETCERCVRVKAAHDAAFWKSKAAAEVTK